jgi:hypothetical protein
MNHSLDSLFPQLLISRGLSLIGVRIVGILALKPSTIEGCIRSFEDTLPYSTALPIIT